MSWPLVRLDQIYDIARGGSPRPIKKFITDSEDGINWIKISDATASSKYIYETKEKIIKEGIQKSRLVKKGDFILSNSMSFGRPYIMRTSGCIHDGWLVLSPKDNSVDQDFLYHLLGSPFAFKQFDSLAAGSTVRNLNIDLVSSVKIPLLPIKEQKRIVAILDEAFEQIDQAKANAEQNLKNAREVFESYLSNTFTPAKTKWEVKKLGKVFKTGAGGTPLKSNKAFYDNGTIPWLLSGEVGVREIFQSKKFITQYGLENSSAKLFPENSVLIAMYGATAGELGILRFQSTTNQAVCAIYPHKSFIPEFIYYFFLNFKSKLISQAVGNAQPNISQQKIKNTEIPILQIEEQKLIVAMLDKVHKQSIKLQETYNQKIKALDELKQSLLQKAFSGELTKSADGDAA